MTPERAIGLHLADETAVRNIAGERIHEIELPQSPGLPAVRVALVGQPTLHHLRGTTNLSRARIQVDAFVDEASATADVDPGDVVDTLAEAIRDALSGKTFTVGTPAAIRITGAFAFGERRKLREVHDELRLLRSSQDYVVWSYQL